MLKCVVPECLGGGWFIVRGIVSVLGAVAFGLLVAVPVSVPAPRNGSMSVVFERTWGNSSADAAAIGPDGSLYVAGFTVVGEYPLQDLDATLLRFTAGGDLLWARSWAVSETRARRRSRSTARARHM